LFGIDLNAKEKVGDCTFTANAKVDLTKKGIKTSGDLDCTGPLPFGTGASFENHFRAQATFGLTDLVLNDGKIGKGVTIFFPHIHPPSGFPDEVKTILFYTGGDWTRSLPDTTTNGQVTIGVDALLEIHGIRLTVGPAKWHDFNEHDEKYFLNFKLGGP